MLPFPVRGSHARAAFIHVASDGSNVGVASPTPGIGDCDDNTGNTNTNTDSEHPHTWQILRKGHEIDREECTCLTGGLQEISLPLQILFLGEIVEES